MHGQTDPRKYLLIAGILQIVWGFDPAASKYVIDEIPVELYIALRWTISGVIFALFLAATGQWRRVATRDLFAVAGLEFSVTAWPPSELFMG
jgi:hypothetical protein